MASATVDQGRHDRIHLYVDGELHQALVDKCKAGQSVDDLVEEILADGAKWLDVRDRIHNRSPVVRDLNDPEPLSKQDALGVPTTGKRVVCECCRPGYCKCSFDWRNTQRCGCTPERLAYLKANGSYLK